MTIRPKKLSGLKFITSFKIDPQFYLQAEKNTLRKWHILYSNIWELTRTPRNSRNHLKITKNVCEHEQTSLQTDSLAKVTTEFALSICD